VAWTTESKSLWLTLTAADPGHSVASRMGASLCAATGLEELICPSPEAYLERAIALGHQPAELEHLRRQPPHYSHFISGPNIAVVVVAPEVAQAVAFAEASAYPSDEELSTDVYA
jgi:hypothetical protein